MKKSSKNYFQMPLLGIGVCLVAFANSANLNAQSYDSNVYQLPTTTTDEEAHSLLCVEDGIGEVKVPLTTPNYTAMMSSNVKTGTGLMVGISGTGVSSYPTDYRRFIGVRGEAGNGESGYNYGLYGQLTGNRWGTALYSTVYANDYPVISGRYAGYFHGNVYMTGVLYAEYIESPSLYGYLWENTSNMYVSGAHSMSSRLACVNTTCAERTASIQSTQDEVVEERVHYGLSASDIEEFFPEIMKINEDGTKMVNYMELIPILVQAINELKAEVDELKGIRSPSRPMMSPSRTTGISTVSSNDDSSTLYNLYGRRITSETKNNIIIRDGQKTIVK